MPLHVKPTLFIRNSLVKTNIKRLCFICLFNILQLYIYHYPIRIPQFLASGSTSFSTHQFLASGTHIVTSTHLQAQVWHEGQGHAAHSRSQLACGSCGEP